MIGDLQAIKEALDQIVVAMASTEGYVNVIADRLDFQDTVVGGLVGTEERLLDHLAAVAASVTDLDRRLDDALGRFESETAVLRDALHSVMDRLNGLDMA